MPGFHINGALTLGENIADIAGIEIAYKAYIASLNGAAPPSIDGMTAEQRFYIGFAQSWLGKRRDASTIAGIKSDPHSPEKYRVNGVVIHMPTYYSAFSVKPGDKMYLPPGPEPFSDDPSVPGGRGPLHGRSSHRPRHPLSPR